MKKETFYITTPIYYPSGEFHIGTAYTTIASDAMARYKRLRGFDVRFLTGLDEHGQKIEEKAIEAGKAPQVYVDEIADIARKLWKKLNISNDDFIQTTQERHTVLVQKIFEKFVAQGDIYKGEYEGMYCTPCETHLTKREVGEENLCPDCNRPVRTIKEETYFFKMSKYADRLIAHYEANPQFIMPEYRMTEMINGFLKPGLTDLSVTRTTFDWGIHVESDPKHVIYVWLDALVNYITVLGYPSDNDELMRYWPANTHVVGKDIIRFHTIYWPIFLMALDLPLPKRVFAHGFFTVNGEKMSKSKGNVLSPDFLADKYGVDAVRYALLRELPFGQDGDFSAKAFIERINFDLANDLGNLLNRTVAMINKYFDGQIPACQGEATEFDKDLQTFFSEATLKIETSFEDMAYSVVLAEIWSVVSRLNKYIDQTEPWVLAKDEARTNELASSMRHLAEGLRQISILISPFIPETADKMLTQIGLEVAGPWESIGKFDVIADGVTVVKKGEPIFPRLEIEEEVNFITEVMKKAAEVENGTSDVATPEEENLIGIEDFAKIELKIGEIKEVRKHPKADRLLVSQIDTGGRLRQIVSGISEHYTPEELVGKKVIVVTNLKPVKLRGELSEGMVLAASHESKLELPEVQGLPAGSVVK